MLLEILLSVVVVYLVSYVIQTWLECRKLPPGPIPLPFIGNLHQVGKKPPFSLEALSKKYPHVMRLKFPFGYCIFLNSVEAVREAMLTNKTDFAGKPTEQFYPTTVIMEERDMGTIDYGPAFVFRSKVFKNALHLFGTQTKVLEKRFNDIVMSMFERLDNLLGKTSISIKSLKVQSLHLCGSLSSERLPHDHHKIQEVIDFIEKSNYLGRQGSYYQLFPILRYLPSNFKKCLQEVLDARYKLFGEVYENHKATYKDGVVRDMTDAMILSYFNEESKGKNIHGTLDDVMFLIIDVMAAGAETSISTLNWCVLHLVLNEDKQNKIHDELDRCMENETMPKIADLKKFHYLNAFVSEVFRLTSVLPFFPPHRTLRDTTVMGYNIPKHMMVLVNNHCINSNPLNWKDPSTFDPGRFLDDNGDFVGWTKHEVFIPFGLGHRACPGKDLGKLQLLTILASFLKCYHIKFSENQEVPPLQDPVMGATTRPKDYLVTFAKRK
ncbi:LOW QUALITY PROTEIN: cytochrome P450 1A1-like [Xenia sp. Carnegie-2017]|uniref:LOW QUALITY PROTEIN: cytochrome P450 1A1-like n=1 Tax=Xenia sp. Carnegie-2017 TaxID=2897299 RepID=UPI001F04A548|nr:LOW QUALITY PROTEIN: cytochrome P450 1A1-like [Xenia sp. Carnegie-2017]